MNPAHLLVYGFAPGAEFEGRLVGAIERIESGGALRVLDVLFVMRDADARVGASPGRRRLAHGRQAVGKRARRRRRARRASADLIAVAARGEKRG